MTDDRVIEWAFMHVYHQDCANAAMHCGDVRFSPITFRLAETLSALKEDPIPTKELDHVMRHRGWYEEDPGR
jgi:hypothetical protein